MARKSRSAGTTPIHNLIVELKDVEDQQ